MKPPCRHPAGHRSRSAAPMRAYNRAATGRSRQRGKQRAVLFSRAAPRREQPEEGGVLVRSQEQDAVKIPGVKKSWKVSAIPCPELERDKPPGRPRRSNASVSVGCLLPRNTGSEDTCAASASAELESCAARAAVRRCPTPKHLSRFPPSPRMAPKPGQPCQCRRTLTTDASPRQRSAVPADPPKVLADAAQRKNQQQPATNGRRRLKASAAACPSPTWADALRPASFLQE